MRTQKKGRIAFAVCGSFCTLEAALAAAQQLTEQGWELLPIMSFAAKQDTRFGTGQFWQERLEALTGHAVLDTLQAVEPLGPKKLVSALVIAPCTGATLARLAEGLSDNYLNEARVREAMLKHARQRFLIMDHTKFDESANIRFNGLELVNAIITDIQPSAEWAAFCQSKNIRLVY